MILLVAAGVGLFCFGCGFVWGTYYGVRREYEANQETLYRLERWRRTHA